MQNLSSKIRIRKKPRFIPLRFRFIFIISGILILLLGTLAVVLGFIQSRTIRSQIEQRGFGIAQSLAAATMADLSTYNYVALERSANQAARNPDIVYVIIHDKEGRVAGYSNRPDLQNRILEDPVSKKAVTSITPLIQKDFIQPDRPPVLDVAVPVYLANSQSRWGTIRLGLSLVPMYQQIRQTQWIILAVGLVALSIGIVVSIWAARRVTRPLGNLVQATMEVARGHLNQSVSVQTGDEVEVLAANFSSMIHQILDHRKQLELQLVEIKRLHRYTEKLLITMSDGLLSVDMNGAVVTANPAVQSILNISGSGLIKGSRLSEFLEPDSILLAHIAELRDNPHSASSREIHIHEGEKAKTVLVGSSLLTDESGTPIEIILNLHDITELKKLEARFRQTERLAALGTLAAGLSHEIRNPLSAIKTFVQLLPRKIERPGFLDKFQRTVPREINRINQLIEDLLDLARPPRFQFAPTDIGRLLKRIIDLLDAEFQNRNIRCASRIPANLPLIRADSDQLTKAFQNLMQNAVQSMPGGGNLTIEVCYGDNTPMLNPVTESVNGCVSIVFQDAGSGISEDALKNIFNPFFTTKDKGTGLGLAITHKVITEHGGRIEVDSGAGGTRFIVGLPVYRDSVIDDAFC